MSKPLIDCSRSPFSSPSVPSSVSGADAEQANADDLAVLLLGHDARRLHELGLVFQDLVDHLTVDVELVGAHFLNLGSDVRRDRRGAAHGGRGGGGGVGAGAAAVAAGLLGLNICIWQIADPSESTTRFHSMICTMRPAPISSPTRTSLVCGVAPAAERAAIDHAGSARGDDDRAPSRRRRAGAFS